MPASGLSKSFIEVIPRTMSVIRQEMRAIARSELSVVQFRVLANVWRRPMSNKDLAESIGCSVPGMSRIIDVLVRKGLVTRTAGKSDRRQIVVGLSPKGRAKFEELRGVAESRISRQLDTLSPESRLQLAAGLRVLERLYEVNA